tara:strand:+ start:2937 stop:3413 length:477 start_codon:yes stop_codon:yes gene_type:complete
MKNLVSKMTLPSQRNRFFSPLKSFNDFESGMDRWFRQNPFDLALMPENLDAAFVPACSIKENKKEYSFQIDVPGIKKEDIKIEVEANQITISGERKDKRDESDAKHTLNETYYGSFMRSFSLPQAINENQVQAHYEAGVLTIVAPKTEATKAKEVKVQ